MAVDFTLNPAQRELQASARTFARQELVQVAALCADLPDSESRFQATRPVYEKMVRAGFLRRMIPQPYGGDGTGLVDMAVVTEEFYAVETNVTLTLLATLLGLMPVMLAGSSEQQQRLLAPFLDCTGTPLAALCNSEPGGSANYGAPAPAAGTRTRAERDGDEWVIHGAKRWVSSATGWDRAGAELLCVVCRTDATADPAEGLSIIAVTRPYSGLVAEKFIDSLGHRAHLMPQFRLDGTRAAADNVLGVVGGGLATVDLSFTSTAALVGVLATAILRAAFSFALDFARREARGGPYPIIEHQAVGYALADAKSALEACRSLSYRSCFAMDSMSEDAVELALHSKVFCTETAVRVITELMRVVGIESYDLANPLAGYLQDALVMPLFDGGNMGVRRRQLHTLLRDPAYDGERGTLS